MYSILGRGSVCFNYCLNSAWHGGDQFVHCWGGMEAQVSLTVAFSSSACLVSCFSFSSWQYLIYYLRGSGLVSLLASQAHQHHGHLTNVWCFWQCGQVPNPAGKWNQHLLLVSRRKHVVLHNFLVNGCSDVGFQKTQWTNTSRWHCTPNHHRLWKLNTGLQATWAMSFSTLPPDSRTLFPNEIQNLLSSEKRTLDHWATVQFFFSLAQVRRLWDNCSQIPRHVCVWWLLMPWPQPQSFLWSSPKLLNRFCLTILIRLRFSRLVVHIFLQHFFFHSTFC